MKPKSLLLIPLALAGMLMLTMAFTLHPVRAQGGIIVDKQLGRSNPVIHVGEYITFTIRIRNNAGFDITQLPLSDDFNTNVLKFVDANPMPDSVDETGGHLEWNDLTTSFGDLAPNWEIVVVAGFIAEHPEPAVVNAARVHDALGSGGALSDTETISKETESIGGSSPVNKEIWAGLQPQVGMPLTYTIVLTNDGYATMTVAPMVDAYNPGWMTFSHSLPAPDVTDTVNGRLVWNDLTLFFGDIPPHGIVSVTTVFTALATGVNISNTAEVSGARDWYDNDLDGGADQVPIIIIPGEETPTTVPTEAPTQPAPSGPSSPAPNPQPTSTPTPMPTPTPFPFLLPETGWVTGFRLGDLLMGVAFLGVGLGLLAFFFSRKNRLP